MALDTGRRLGPYEVLAPLGAGGMGEVYVARDGRLDRQVAVKVLPEHLLRDPQALQRFEREAKALAALSHPNILTIFDVGSEAEVAFVVMELLEGETLRERIARAPLTWREALQFAIAAAEGLAAAHSRGVIHGDLKPANVFVTRNGLVKLLDFGLARFDSDRAGDVSQAVTLVGSPETLMGTVPYMSPEQVRGQAVDARSDVFSFGSMLYEMLAGKPPFAGASLPELMAAILRDPVPETRGMAAAIPSSLDQLMRACLHKSPEDRIQSGRELAVALRAVVSEITAPVLARPAARRRTRRIDSIAVLPISQPDATPQTEYLCDGMTDRIINTLSHLPGLRVMASSTVFRYKGRAVSPQAVGGELGVRAVLAGTATQRGEALTIQLELVDATDGARLWGTQYDCTVDNILELQEKLAAQVTEQLRPKLVQKEKKSPRRRPTESSEAYRLFLQGRYFWNKRTREGLFRSLEYYEQALQLDPRFPLAHVGLSDSYWMLGGFGYLSPKEAYTKAKMEAMQALELDPTLAEARSALATVKYRFDWDWEGADAEFRLALRYNPGYSTAHLWYGVFLVLMGRFETGLPEVEKALEMDPLSLVVHWTRGYVLYYMRRFDAALEQYRRTLSIDPTFARVHIDIGIINVLQGKFQAGIEEIRKAMSLMEQSPSLLASLGYAYAVSGDRAEAAKILAELETQSKRSYVSPFTFAIVHVGLGDPDAAFDCLEKSLELREDALTSLRVNPRLDPLRSMPRFEALLRRIGLSA